MYTLRHSRLLFGVFDVCLPHFAIAVHPFLLIHIEIDHPIYSTSSSRADHRNRTVEAKKTNTDEDVMSVARTENTKMYMNTNGCALNG